MSQREPERDRASQRDYEPTLHASTLFCCKTVKYDSALSRNVKIRYFLSRNVKIRYFTTFNSEHDTHCIAELASMAKDVKENQRRGIISEVSEKLSDNIYIYLYITYIFISGVQSEQWPPSWSLVEGSERVETALENQKLLSGPCLWPSLHSS